MKKLLILFSAFLAALVSYPSFGNAEKIYCKDGTVVDATILRRSRDSIWIKHASGAIGIGVGDIAGIKNNDGSVSKYDYGFISGAIRDFIVQRKYSEAIQMCSLLLGSFPNDVQLHQLRGLLNQRAGNFEQATADYDFLVKQGVADEQIFNNLGAIYAQKKEPREARDFFVKALERNPDTVEAHNNLAVLSLQASDYRGAIDEYNKVIEKEPGNVTALYNLGIAYMQREDFSKAKTQWEKIIAIKPDDGNATHALKYLSVKNDTPAVH